MEYFEVTLADGRHVIACDAPDTYVERCLENTGAVFEKTTEQRARELNSYHHANGGSGWDLLRMQALEAKVKVLEEKVKQLTSTSA